MDTPISSLAAGVRSSQTNKEGKKPHGSRKQQGGNLRVSKCLDDGREEILEGLCEEGDVLEQDEDVEAVVSQCEHEAILDGDRSSGVGFFGIIDEAPLCEVALFFREPLGGCWKIGKEDTV